jgi:nucleotide-binding universal stress UspA family protein
MSTIPGNSIVVAVDGSPSSQAALDWAIDEAGRRSLPLHLLHAFGVDYSMMPRPTLSPDGTSVDDELLDAGMARVRSLAPAVRVTSEADTGYPAPALVALSGTADTIVLGARGRGAVRGALLGSVSLQVAMHARCPVVVVRELPAPGPSVPRVVVGIDGSPTSERAIEYAFAQASLRGLGLTVVHAWWMEFVEGVIATTSSEEQWERMGQEQRALVSESLAGWHEKYPDVDVRQHVVRSLPAEALIGESAGAELVVVGSRGRGGFRGLLLGSVSHSVMQHAHCPVAVVRPRHDTAEA